MVDIGEMMRRGIDGVLINSESFRSIRYRYPNGYVIMSFCVLFGVSTFTTSSTFGTIITYILWLGLAFTYLAVGTKNAHTMAFVICIIGFTLSLMNVLASMYLLALASSINQFLGENLGVGELIVRLVVFAGFGALFGYLVVQMHGAMKSLQYPVRPN